jgi:hypothetical protein
VWTRERVYAEVARIAGGHGGTPSAVYIMRHHAGLFCAMYRLFDSYHDVCELAGLKSLRPGYRTDRNRRHADRCDQRLEHGGGRLRAELQ